MTKEMDLNRLGREEIAILLCVSTKSIEVYTKQVVNPLPYHLEEAKKVYVWEECFNWYVGMKTVKATKFKPADELSQAKLEGQNLQNQKLQLELDEKEGRLLKVEDVEKVWSDTLLDIKNALINVGHISSSSILDGMNYNIKKTIIDTNIFDALEGVINRVNKDSEEAEANSDTEESI